MLHCVNIRALALSNYQRYHIQKYSQTQKTTASVTHMLRKALISDVHVWLFINMTKNIDISVVWRMEKSNLVGSQGINKHTFNFPINSLWNTFRNREIKMCKANPNDNKGFLSHLRKVNLCFLGVFCKMEISSD